MHVVFVVVVVVSVDLRSIIWNGTIDEGSILYRIDGLCAVEIYRLSIVQRVGASQTATPDLII